MKKHEFFEGIDWQKLMALELAPPFEPDLDEEAPSPQQHARHDNTPATRRSHRASACSVAVAPADTEGVVGAGPAARLLLPGAPPFIIIYYHGLGH